MNLIIIIIIYYNIVENLINYINIKNMIIINNNDKLYQYQEYDNNK